LGYIDVGRGQPKKLDPAKAPMVRQAFELYASARYNLHGLVEEMYQLGLRNRNGGKVSLNGFSTMLNNPFYIGLIRLKRTNETFPGSHEPLIPKSIFDRVHRILNGKTNTRVQKHDFLFRRLLKCKHCGYSLIGEMKKGYTYYRCQTKDCPTTCIREEKIEEEALLKFSHLQFKEQEIGYLKKQTAKLKENWGKEQENQIGALSLRLNQIQERMARLTDAYIDRIIDKEIFEERKTALLMERKDMEEKMDQLKTGMLSIPDRLAEFLELAGSAYLSYKMGFSEEKRDLMKILTSNREVDGKNVDLRLAIPFEGVANRYKYSNGVPQPDIPRTLDTLLHNLTEHFKTQPSPGDPDDSADRRRKKLLRQFLMRQ